MAAGKNELLGSNVEANLCMRALLAVPQQKMHVLLK